MAGNYSYQGDDFDNVFLKDYTVLDKTVGAGSLWSWGKNDKGQLGTNNITNRSSPIQTISGGTNWKTLPVSSWVGDAKYVIKSDGTLWAWGHNNYGKLGDNTTANKSSPVQTVAGGTNWAYVAAGCFTAGAIKTDGTLWMWGQNFGGGLGDGTRTDRSSPVQIGENNWVQLATGYHTGAIKTDGTLWMWGFNNNGQLGDGSSVANRSSPVQIVTGGTWKQYMGGGAYFSGGIKTDGTLWMWGDNAYGQLGDNTITKKSSPVQTVAGGTNWRQLSFGYQHSTATKTDGTLWLWGRNDYGQMGDNTRTTRTSPIQAITGGTNWKQSAAGFAESAGIKTDGTLWLWGRNYFGGLGNGEGGGASYKKSSPVQTVAGGTNWKQVSFTYNNASAIYFFDSIDSYPNA
jgi:alpha-tubulin suppressor-like RCC1 family protein